MNFYSLAYQILYFINVFLVPLIFAIAFIVFLWGIFQYFIAGGADEEKRKEGRNLALWGILGFFIMISVWGLVNVISGTFRFNNKLMNLPSSGAEINGGGTFNSGTKSGSWLAPDSRGVPGGAPLDGPSGVGNPANQGGNPNSGLCTPDQPENC